MKKLKVILSVFALVLAIGGTFATQYTSTATIDGYEFIPAQGMDPAECVLEQGLDCNPDAGDPCTIGTVTYREDPTISTECGEVLHKN